METAKISDKLPAFLLLPRGDLYFTQDYSPLGIQMPNEFDEEKVKECFEAANTSGKFNNTVFVSQAQLIMEVYNAGLLNPEEGPGNYYVM